MEKTNDQATISQYFYQTCDQYPDNIAVYHDGQKRSFQHLRYDSNRIAQIILDFTHGESVPLVIYGDSRYETVCAITAVCLSGAYFSFLDNDHSLNHNQKVVGQLEPQLVLTTREWLPKVEEIINGTTRIIVLDGFILGTYHPDIHRSFSKHRPLMIPFTSGSTGEPQGFVVLIEGAIDRHQAVIKKTNANAKDVQSSTMSFSLSWGIPVVFYMMISGCAISIFRYGQHTPLEIVEWIHRDRLTILQMPSSYFHQFMHTLADHPEIDLPTVRLINTGGEKLNVESLRLWQAHPNLDFIVRDSMSSTETATYFTVSYTKQSLIPDEIIFDEPAPNAQVFIRTADDQLKQADAEGELAVYSTALVHEYFRDPEKTNQRFIPHPTDPTKRIFLTRDMGRLDQQGRLILKGRADHVVKIRGYRIDLEEVRAEMKKISAIKDVAVVKTRGKRGDDILGAYVLFHPGMRLTVSELKIELHRQLNAYKVPSLIMSVESLPYGTIGKIQHSKLPPISHQRPELSEPFVKPDGPYEEEIIAIWEEILDIHGIGVNDDFFELGGDSISAVEMMSVVEDRLNWNVPLSFFDQPTVAVLVKTKSEASQKQESQIERAIRTRDFYFFQKRNLYHPRVWFTKYLTGKPYPEALEIVQNLSRNPLLRDGVYSRQKVWFSRWLKLLGKNHLSKSDFEKFVVADLSHTFGWIKQADSLTSTVNQKTSEEHLTVFGQSLADKLKLTLDHQGFDWLPITGFNHFLKAVAECRGVILLGIHNNVRFDISPIIEKFAGIEPMITVSYNLGKYGKYGQGSAGAEYHQLAASNASVAADAEKKLREGRVIQVFSDTHDDRTKNYTALLLGKPRNFKAGFAELAVRTGAPVIPTMNYIDDQYRVARVFFPPLHTDQPSYDGKILEMVEQYARFIENAWREHPEIQTLSKIKKFFRMGMSWQ